MAVNLKNNKLPTGDRGQMTRDPLTSPTLPSRYYFDETIYRSEMTHIHRKAWTYIGHVSEVAKPGQYFTDIVGEQPIVVVCGRDEVVRCFYNVCSHRGHKLLEGSGQLKSKGIMCPYHAWMYSLDGRLGSARLSEGVAGFDKAEFGLVAGVTDKGYYTNSFHLDV